MLEYRITSYDPAFRNSTGAYTRNEWTYFSDIGHMFADVKLTENECQREVFVVSPNQTCDADVITATTTDFELRNNKKPQNFIIGEVNAVDELSFWVENQPADGTGCPGWWMFDQMMEHFEVIRNTISVVIGYWVYGDNLALVNRLTAGNAMTLEEAAKQTKTGGYARTWNYTNIAVVYPTPGNPNSSSTIGTQGNYTKLYVRFES